MARYSLFVLKVPLNTNQPTFIVVGGVLQALVIESCKLLWICLWFDFRCLWYFPWCRGYSTRYYRCLSWLCTFLFLERVCYTVQFFNIQSRSIRLCFLLFTATYMAAPSRAIYRKVRGIYLASAECERGGLHPGVVRHITFWKLFGTLHRRWYIFAHFGHCKCKDMRAFWQLLP